MKFTVNRTIVKEDGIRALTPECSYVRDLQETGDAVTIGNVVVDGREIIDRRFACDTLHCVRVTAKRGRLKGSCCTDLEVDLTPSEERRIRRLAGLYLASPAADAGSPAHGIAEGIVRGNGWIEENHLGETRLTHGKRKTCSMGYLDRDGRLLCALNTMASALGDSIAKWKLQTCFLFPLHYVEFEDGRYLLTIISKRNHEKMEACEEAATVRCIRKPAPGAPRAYEFLRGEIELLLGKRFYRELERAANERLAARG